MPRLLAALAIALMSAACNFHECSSDINQKFLPSDTTIAIGQQFTAQVVVTTCDGRQILSANPTWHSQDATIASVEPATGRVTGQAPGMTAITATGAFYTITGSIRVTVH